MILISLRIIKIFNLDLLMLYINLYNLQHKSIIKILSLGPIKNIIILKEDSFIHSLDKSLVASEIGWVTPEIKILLGPLR